MNTPDMTLDEGVDSVGSSNAVDPISVWPAEWAVWWLCIIWGQGMVTHFISYRLMYRELLAETTMLQGLGKMGK